MDHACDETPSGGMPPCRRVGGTAQSAAHSDHRPAVPLPVFAVTKIQPPRLRRGLVPRALDERLERAVLERRLVLLSAPAGYGKTALLTRLIDRLGTRAAVAWIAVDAEDDPLGLLACLCAALEPYDPPWRTDPEALVAMAGGTRQDRRIVLGELLNALAACEIPRGLIVVEDAHRIRDGAAFEFLDQLLERMPPQWSVVVSTRADPPLSLARLRAQGELEELREADLRFTLADTRALLDGIGRAAKADGDGGGADTLVRRLHQRTGGWAAGLRLVCNALEGGRHAAGLRAVSGAEAERHAFDYLLAEVLDALPDALRRFLLRASVLAELTAGRAAAVSGDAAAGTWLDEIERRGLFASVLEGAEPTLRLHDLFRDFLADRLRREMPEELPALLHRAAATEPDLLRRIDYLVAAGDWAAAEDALAAEGAALVSTFGATPVERLLERIPAEWRARSGRLEHLAAMAAWSRWDFVAMRANAARAAAAHAAAGDAAGLWRASLYEQLAAGLGAAPEVRQRVAAPPPGQAEGDRALAGLGRCYAAFEEGRFDTVHALYAETLDHVARDDTVVVWYQCAPRSQLLGLPGMRAQLLRFAAGALAAAPETPTPLRAIALATRAWCETVTGDAATAEATLAIALADARWLGPPPNVRVQLNSVLGWLRAVQGRAAESAAAVDEALRAFDDPDAGARRGSAFHGWFRLQAIQLAQIAGDAARAAALRAQGPIEPSPHPAFAAMARAQHAAIEGRDALAAGDLARAAERFEAALSVPARGAANALGPYAHAREVALLRTHALLRLGRHDEAADELAVVLAYARRDGEPGGALAVPPEVLATLAAHPWPGRLVDAAATLRRWAALRASLLGVAVPTGAAIAPASLRDPLGGPVGPLSPRELDVLRQIAEGESNKRIARTFELSPHTVKRHVANILDKLGCSSRGQAAAWYRQHGPAAG